MYTKSAFRWTMREPNFIIIEDLFDENNPTMSVTNDMENVLEFIGNQLEFHSIDYYHICCQNTNKTWDYVKNHGNPEWIYTEVETLDLLISKIIGEVP